LLDATATGLVYGGGVMARDQQSELRWEPIAGIPESTAYDYAVESRRATKLTVVLEYSKVKGNPVRNLELAFEEVAAFRGRWDGDIPAVGALADPPRCAYGPCKGMTWSLIIVENSQWLASPDLLTSTSVAKASGKERWRHYAIVTMERGLDVIARGIVQARWVPTSDG
jgi:hypothetical protein